MAISEHLLSEEVHARFLAGGLTRYTYAEVAQAAAEVDGLAAAWKALTDRIYWTYLEPERIAQQGYFLWDAYLEGDARLLYDLAYRVEEPALRWGNHPDHFPIKEWAKGARQYRRLIARLSAAVAQVEKQAAT
jgi:hypothetical protein